MNEIQKALSPVEQFQERVRVKVRDQVADMLPESVIDEMTKKAVNDLFFVREKAQRDIPGGGWNSKETYEKPSFFEDEVLKAAKPLIEASIASWVETNQHLLLEMWSKAFDVGIQKYAQNKLDAEMQAAMRPTLAAMLAKINESRRHQNLPELTCYFP